MKKIVFYIIPLVILWACIPKGKEEVSLKRLNPTEIRAMIQNKKFNYAYATFLNEHGNPIDSTEKSELGQGKLAKDYYINKKGSIEEVRVRQMNLSDQFLEIAIRELSASTLALDDQVHIDCYLIQEYLEKMQEADQRLAWNDWDKRQALQAQEERILLSIIDQCGFPTLSKNDSLKENNLFYERLIFGSTKLLSYYLPEIEQGAIQGCFPLKYLAVIQDRLLSRHGFKQWYGTQIFRGRLAKIEDPEHVDKRREVMGLQPIDSLLQQFDTTLEKELLRLQKSELVAPSD